MTNEKEIFCQEMNKIIFHFNELIKELNFDTENLQVIRQLIHKVISNVSSANILVYGNHFKEAQIVLRSAVETVVLITYLSQFPEKATEYIADSQILRLKNAFITYKADDLDEPVIVNGKTVTDEDLINDLLKGFESFIHLAKEKILRGIKEDTFEINSEICPKIDNFFRKFKPFFMDLKCMYKALSDKGFTIANKLDLREGIFMFYNPSSQLAHGCYFDWASNSDFNQEKEHLLQFFNKTLFLIKCILDKIMQTNINDKTNKLLLTIFESTEKLNIMIYGDTMLAEGI